MEGQVRWAAQEELAASVADVLVRRTQLFFRDRDQGLGCAERVADLLAEELGWTPREREASVTAYRAEVALGRRWQEGMAAELRDEGGDAAGMGMGEGEGTERAVPRGAPPGELAAE